MKDVRRLQDSGWKLDGVLEGRVEGVDHRRPPVAHPVRLVHLKKPWFMSVCNFEWIRFNFNFKVHFSNSHSTINANADRKQLGMRT